MVQSRRAWRAYIEARDAAFTTWLNTMMPMENVDRAELEERKAAADAVLEMDNAEAWIAYLDSAGRAGE